MVRTSKTAPAAPEPEPPALGDVQAPLKLIAVSDEFLGEVTLPGEVVDPLVIGPASAPMTPGWLMGIGSRAETAAEHNTRLGASAGKFNDAGFLLGNLAPRVGWPMGDVPAQLP